MNSFKVAIIGGSIAGLTTALHLEKLGIDWILLERRDEIAPQLGASIALAPNGLSILSQLGCFEDVDSKSFPMTDFTSRKSNGVVLNQFDTTDHIRSRFGFDIYITERKTAVESLYRQIQHKDKITSGQKIAKIDQTDNGVEIVAENDRRWTADIVVGADGVHSFTRKEMWRMASKEDPNIFPKDLEKQVQTEYGCVFGISNRTNDLKAGEVIHIHESDILIGILTGHDDIVYWFLIFSCPKLEGLDLPRYSSQDESDIVARAASMQIKPGTTFADIYKNKTRTNMSPLPYYAFERWHYKRLICIGDSIHKFNPITGQGGCFALESAVSLVDNLHEALTKHQNGRLSTDEIEYAFEKTTQIRRQRVAAGVDESMQAIRFGTWSNLAWKLLDNYIMWLVPGSTMVDIMTNGVKGAYQSSTLPQAVPKFKTAA